MTICDDCGEEFLTLTSAWGDATCDACLQARIDRALADLPLGGRKPLRRATAPSQGPEEADVRKAAHG